MSSKEEHNKFTFKNYLKYWAQKWFIILICVIVGLIGGFIYVKNESTTYSATLKILIHNADIDQGGAASPYIQFKDILISEELLKNQNIDINPGNLTVEESPRGVFMITVTDSNSEKAVKDVKVLSENIGNIISQAYSDSEKYEISVLSIDTDATASTSRKKNIIMILLAGIAMGIIASVVLFIKFDFSTEK